MSSILQLVAQNTTVIVLCMAMFEARLDQAESIPQYKLIDTATLNLGVVFKRRSLATYGSVVPLFDITHWFALRSLSNFQPNAASHLFRSLFHRPVNCSHSIIVHDNCTTSTNESLLLRYLQ